MAPGHPSPSREPAPRRIGRAAGARLHGRAPQLHQMAGWHTVSISIEGGNVMTPDRVTRRRVG